MLESEEQNNQPSNSKEPPKENPSNNSKEIGAMLVSKLLSDDEAAGGESSTEKDKHAEKKNGEDSDSEPTTPSHDAPRAFERSNNLYQNFPEPDNVEEELDEWYWWTEDLVIEKPKDENNSYRL